MKVVLLSLLIAAIRQYAAAFSYLRIQPGHSLRRQNFDIRLHAANGPPQYEKMEGILKKAEILGDGVAMLHVETEVKIDYKPGHVMALEIKDETSTATVSKKNIEDTVNNGGWMRGPYTISRASDNSFDVLIKVVGDKSKAFASAKPGTVLKFGGKFKVPILDGIHKDAKRVVMISTGVGIGPCVGAIEDALLLSEKSNKDATSSFPPIELYASFRTGSEVVYSGYLDSLVEKNGPQRFKWTPIITNEIGRISASEKNLKQVFASASSEIDSQKNLSDTHFHLIGNGQMVNEWKAGLVKAGVKDEYITLEMYFNHNALASEDAINNISNAAKKSFPAQSEHPLTA